MKATYLKMIPTPILPQIFSNSDELFGRHFGEVVVIDDRSSILRAAFKYIACGCFGAVFSEQATCHIHFRAE
jgi:hypothetical protein